MDLKCLFYIKMEIVGDLSLLDDVDLIPLDGFLHCILLHFYVFKWNILF